MEKTLLMFLAVGTVLMVAVMLICRQWRPCLIWKLLCIAVLLTIAGTVSVMSMFFLETGRWGGLSFFGAVLFVPAFFVLVKLLFKMPYGELMDLCGPSECVMLALMKVQCYATGCCKGRVMHVDAAGVDVRFPSQLVELFFALIIMVALMLCMRKAGNVGKIYPYYMISYGVSRFVLNLFRETSPFIWILPAGNFWSLISIAIGVSWLLILKKVSARKTEETL